MSINQHSTVVGVFSDRSMARQAVEALRNAGFNQDQIRYAGPGGTGSASGSFFEDLKSLFMGQDTTRGNLASDLTDMGLSNEEAQYYAHECDQGHSVIAVSAPDREQEAMSILQSQGAYNNYSVWSSSREPIAPDQQPSSYVPGSNTPTYGPSSARQPDTQTQVTRERAARVSQQAADTVRHDTPIQAAQAPAAQERQQATDRYQALQAQLQETQRQLQEAQARLQAAKKREAELQAARESEAQLQTTQQQLQETQAQLQTTLEELRATEARIGQSSR
jgi:chemotaxis protein histidine kinase CheA